MAMKFLIGAALAAGVMLPTAASAQRGHRDDPASYVYYDRTGRHFDREAWRAHEERRKRQQWSHRGYQQDRRYERERRREWRQEQRRYDRRYDY